MARFTLYVYAESNDLHDVAAEIESRVQQFIGETRWRYGMPWAVNHRRDIDQPLAPGDMTDWDLGLNFDLPDPPNEPEGWFSDVEKIAMSFAELQSKTGHDFVIGIFDNQRGLSEDLYSIDSAAPDLGVLGLMLGVGGGIS